MDINILDKIDRARKLIVEIVSLGDADEFEAMLKVLQEFEEIFESSDHPEITELYVKSLSNAMVDFNRIQDEKNFVYIIKKMEEISKSNYGNLTLEPYSMSLAGVIRSYTEMNKIAQAKQYLKKLEEIFEQNKDVQFIIEQYGVSVYNLLISVGKDEDLIAVRSNLETLLILNEQFPYCMFNAYVVQGISNSISYLGQAKQIDDFGRLLEHNSRIFNQRHSVKTPPLIEQHYPRQFRENLYYSGYASALYNAGKYYGMYGQLHDMEICLEELVDFFQVPTGLFNHNPVVGEIMGDAFRNACLAYIQANLTEKLEETISTFEKLYKKYPIPRFGFVEELGNIIHLAIEYFESIGNQKKIKEYTKKSKKYIVKKNYNRPFSLQFSGKCQCNSCGASWNVSIMRYEGKHKTEDTAYGEKEKCPRCGGTNIIKQHFY